MPGEEYNSYLTIESESEGIFKDRGSRFIGLAYPVSTEDEIREILNRIRRKYHDARHHCYAWKLGTMNSDTRVSDDGEPRNSAGKPILAQIEASGLTNILVVVVRYFGGTLLGVGGLIHAYKTAGREALNHARMVRKYLYDVYLLKFPYQQINDVMKLLKHMKLEYYDQVLEQECELKVKVNRERSTNFRKKLEENLNIRIELYQPD
jgi:uncharacterized YigZ family protein